MIKVVKILKSENDITKTEKNPQKDNIINKKSTG